MRFARVVYGGPEPDVECNGEPIVDKLWFPQDTQTQKDKKAYEANFPRSGAVSTIIVESRGSNLLLLMPYRTS